MVRGSRIVALACLWLVPLLILTTAFASDWVTVWEKVRLPEWYGPFMDISVISTGVQTQKMGGAILWSTIPGTDFVAKSPTRGSSCIFFPG
jgi:hypothetical protein